MKSPIAYIGREPERVGTPITREEFAQRYQSAFATLRLVAAAELGPSRAEDAVQQACLQAMTQLDRYDRSCSFVGWMAAYVRNNARNIRRGDARRLAREQTSATLASGGETQTPHNEGPHEEQFESALSNAIEQLTDAQRECLLLRVCMDHSYEHISVITGLPKSTVRSHVHRARAHLAAHLRSASVPGTPVHATGVTP